MGFINKLKNNYLLLAIFFLFSCKNSDLDHNGVFSGTVKNIYGQPIANAEIEISNNTIDYSAKTDSTGNFLIRDILSGSYDIEISKDYYMKLKRKLNIIGSKINYTDYVLNSGNVALSVSENFLSVSSKKGAKNIIINSNTSWKILKIDSWLSLSIYKGEGDCNLRIDWGENTELNKRKGNIELISDSISVKISIVQDFSIKLLNYTGLDGIPKLSDSLFLQFNKPVRINSISNGSSEFSYSMTKDSCQVKFKANYFELGSSNHLFYSVSDSFGCVDSNEISINLFTKRLNLNGVINDFILTTDNKFCWFIYGDLKKLFLLSVEKFEIVKEFNLDFAPLKIIYNVYNGKIYLLPKSEPYIYVFDSHLEKIVKTIKIKPQIVNGFENSAIYPYDLCFTNNGLGIILLSERFTSATNYELIDCTLNDSIKSVNWGLVNNTRFKLTPNYDYSKIIITNGRSGPINIFNSKNIEIETLSYSIGGVIIPNRVNNTIFFNSDRNCFILNLENNEVVWKNSNVIVSNTADFSYKENEENILYSIYNHFYYYDFNNDKVLLKYKAWAYLYECPWAFNKLLTTIDGKLLIASGCEYMYLFDTDIFNIK